MAALVIAFLVWSANTYTRYPAPPRVETTLGGAPDPSILVTQVSAPLSAVRAALEEALPVRLVTIDERVPECVPKEQVRVAGLNLFETPSLSCTLKGTITRGAITLDGNGQTLRARVPITARIDVIDLGDIIKRETVTAAANVTLAAALDVRPDWTLGSRVKLRYAWTKAPGVEVLGQRITFTRAANKALAKSLAGVEAKIRAEIRKIDLRKEVAKVWRDGHTALSINRENPPVWMRVTPSEVGAGALRVSGAQVTAEVMLAAGLELVVGERPAPTEPTALGANVGAPPSGGFALKVPVLAQYSELEPVLLAALHKLKVEDVLGDDAALSGTGIEAQFRDVTIYATQGGRLAVGIEARVSKAGWLAAMPWARVQGRVWLTAKPVTQMGSEVLRIEDLSIHGDMDQYAGDLLVRFLNRPAIKERIQSALTADFRKGYGDIVGKAQRGLKSVTIGNAQASFEVEEYSHGAIAVTGEGLFLPVTASGKVTTTLAP